MRLSKHFKREEFACQCGCDFDTVDARLIEVLEMVRGEYKQPITITSGCRCPEHNYKIGGAKDSQHTLGRAADIKVKGVEPEKVYDFLAHGFKNQLGLGLYSGWVHVDTRTNGGARSPTTRRASRPPAPKPAPRWPPPN